MMSNLPYQFLRNSEGGSWPDHSQELLLHAALMEDEMAVNAWRQWKASVDLDNVDWGSGRLLPLVYKNLSRNGIEDPILQRYKGIYRLTWYGNQTNFFHASQLLTKFKNADIKTMLLKGSALTLLNYNDYGLRPMADIDIMVPRAEVEKAVRILEASGRRAKDEVLGTLRTEFFDVMHSHAFIDEANREIDLHWHLIRECLSSDADDPFWEGAVPVELMGVTTLALNPTDQLFHICVHGVEWNPFQTLRWIADAITILNSPVEIDWNRLIDLAQDRKLAWSIGHSLSYLHSRMGANIPTEALQRLAESHVTEKEEIAFTIKSRRRRLLGAIPTHWHTYLRQSVSDNRITNAVGFIKFLMAIWQLDRLWQIPGYVSNKALKRIRYLLTENFN